NVWFYDSGFKAFWSWDYGYLESLVLTYIKNRRFPGIISFNQICDTLIRKIPEKVKLARFKHCVSRTLKLAGYQKGSDRGKAWYYSSIMRLDIHAVQVTHHSHTLYKSCSCTTLCDFFPNLIPV
ncbi:MAG: hypothetical protein JXA44_08320, partial [Methanospirillaceae archaeon]|nr:hypothetical protein [Methanospirillaceae archaeon]